MKPKILKNKAILFFIAGYFVADCLTTWAGILLSPVISEGNPFSKFVFGILGMYAGLVIFKIIVTVVLLGFAVIIRKAIPEININKFAIVLGSEGFIASILNIFTITKILGFI
jgi:hypothetical protein